MGTDLRELLAGYRHRDGKHHFEEMIDLERIIQTATLNEILSLTREIAGDRTKLTNASRFAYRHTNGFRKLTLFKSLDCCLRLHIWESGEDWAENIHSHRWSFASKILAGKVGETRFKISSNGYKNEEFLYSQKPGMPVGELVPSKSVLLSKIDDFVHSESDVYSMSTGGIHRINGGDRDEILITLVLTGKSRELSSRVYSANVEGPRSDRNNGRLTIDETHLALSQAISWLA